MQEVFTFLLEMKSVKDTMIHYQIDKNIVKGREVGALEEPKID